MLLNWRLHELFSPLFYVNYRHYLVRHRLLGDSPKISLFYIEIMNSALIHYLKTSTWRRNLTLFNDMQYLYVGLAIYFPISMGIVCINKLPITSIRFSAPLCIWHISQLNDMVSSTTLIFCCLLVDTTLFSYNYNGFCKQISVFVLLALENKAPFL